VRAARSDQPERFVSDTRDGEPFCIASFLSADDSRIDPRRHRARAEYKETERLGSVDLKVEEHAPDMNGGDEGSGKLCAARSDSPPALEGAEDVFNDVPCPIQFMTVRSLLFPAFNRSDNCAYIRFFL
jgi:hypothetical protein